MAIASWAKPYASVYLPMLTIMAQNNKVSAVIAINPRCLPGKAIGRKAGLPTANLQLPEGKLLPPLGVYGSRVHIGNRSFKGMTNIGPRPTVDNVIKPTVETFILNFDEDCYGAEMTLDIRHYVRGTRKFADLEEVKRQVDQDIRTIEEIEGE